MAQKTTASRVKEELRERGHEFDDDEFDELVQEYSEKFGEMGDEGFAAFAVAKEEFGEKVQGEFTVSSGGVAPEDQSSYTIQEVIENGEQLDENNESFRIQGLVIAKWFQTRDDGEPRWNLRLYDGTAQLRGMASGHDAVDNFQGNPPDVGDYVEIQSTQVYHPEPESPEDDDNFNLLMFGQYAKYNYDVDSEFDLRDSITADVMADPASDGDMVYVEGVVADHDSNTYKGCVDCAKGWDPEELNACPNCGATELEEKQFDNIKVRGISDTPMDVQLSPAVDLDTDDPVFDKYRFYGVYTYRTDDDGSENKQVDAIDFVNLSEQGEDTFDSQTEDSSEEEEQEDEEETEEESDESDEETDESEDETTESSESDGYDVNVLAQAVEDQVEDMDFPIPATSPKKILTNRFEIEEEEVDEPLLQAIKMAESWGSIEVSVDTDETIEEARWQDVILEPAE